MSILRPTTDGPSLVVCTTCKYSAEDPVDDHGQRGGALFLQALQTAAAADPQLAGIAIEPMSCLFACSSFCTVQLRAAGKIGYVLGAFRPTDDAAAALLEYARLYAQSDEGVVPYPLWPEGVKGHFIVRTPPAGMIVAD